MLNDQRNVGMIYEHLSVFLLRIINEITMHISFQKGPAVHRKLSVCNSDNIPEKCSHQSRNISL